jgi:hypothetical protein
MVHWLKRPDYDRFLDTGLMPMSGCFAEEIDRAFIDGLTAAQLASNAMLGLARHAKYARNLLALCSRYDRDARSLVQISLEAIHQDEERVFVVCEFN